MASTHEIAVQDLKTKMTNTLEPKEFDDDFEAQDSTTSLTDFGVKWNDLSHVGKSVVLKALSDHHRSFHHACESLLLYRDDIEKWLCIYRNEQDQERRWKLQLAWWEAQPHEAAEAYQQVDGPVEMKLFTHREMHKAARFVGDFGYTHLASDIKALSHKKFAWPLKIDISTYIPFKIQDGNIANFDQDNRRWDSENSICDVKDEYKVEDNGQYEHDYEHDHEHYHEHYNENEDDEEEAVYDSDLPNPRPVRALVSLALTSPQIKVKNGIRLLTCILPRGTVIVGPRGTRQIMNQAGEYRVCSPPQQRTPVEAESQLDIVTDDLTLTSIVHEEVQTAARVSKANLDNLELVTVNNIDVGESDQDNANKLALNLVESNARIAIFNDQLMKDDPIVIDESMETTAANLEDTVEGTLNHSHSPTTDDLSNIRSYAEQMTESSFFQDAIATSQFHSPQLPTKIAPSQASELPVNAGPDFCLRNEMPNKEKIKARNHLQQQGFIGDRNPEVALDEAFSAAFADDCSLNEVQATWDRVSEAQEDLYKSLSPAYLIKDIPVIASTEFELGLRETLPVGSRPASIAVGPVERSWAPIVADDPLDLAFMTIRMPADYTVISPTGYTMNFNTDHRGPVDGKAPAGEGGVYSFFLPEMAKRLPDNFQPYLRDWVGFRIFVPQQIGLALDGKWLRRWAMPGMHQIAEIDGELDLVNAIGRYRIFNDMHPIGMPVRIEATGSDRRSVAIQEAERIIAPYRQFLQRDEEEEKAEDAIRAEDQRLAQRRVQVRAQRHFQKEQSQKLAAEKEQERRAAIEESERLGTQPLGRGNRARRPTARYLEMTSFTDEVNELIEDDGSNKVSAVDKDNGIQSDDDYVEDVCQTNIPGKNRRVLGMRAPKEEKQKDFHAGNKKVLPGKVESRLNVQGPQSVNSVQATGHRNVLHSAPNSTLDKGGQDTKVVINQQAQSLGVKRAATIDESNETLTKKYRGRLGKSQNEWPNPRPPMSSSVSAYQVFAQAHVPQSLQNSVTSPQSKFEDVRQPMSTHATQWIAPMPPGPQPYTGFVSGNTLPTVGESATQQPAPKSRAPIATMKGYSSMVMDPAIQAQLSGMKLAEKMLPSPKYDLKSARKVALPEDTTRPPHSPSAPPKLAVPTKATAFHQSYVSTKPPLYARTSNAQSPQKALVAPLMSYAPSATAPARQFPAMQPTAAHPSRELNSQSIPNTLSAFSSTPGSTRKLLPGSNPPNSQPHSMLTRPGPTLARELSFHPQTGSMTPLGPPFQPQREFSGSQTPNQSSPNKSPRTTAFTANQLPGNYPASFWTNDGQLRYRSLSGTVFSCPITAIQCDQGAGMIDFDAAILALAKFTGISKK